MFGVGVLWWQSHTPTPTHTSHNHTTAQGDDLSADQIAACEKLGILIDKDDQGILLQIFTKPLGDRCVRAWVCACGSVGLWV